MITNGTLHIGGLFYLQPAQGMTLIILTNADGHSSEILLQQSLLNYKTLLEVRTKENIDTSCFWWNMHAAFYVEYTPETVFETHYILKYSLIVTSFISYMSTIAWLCAHIFFSSSRMTLHECFSWIRQSATNCWTI